jgi:hypothetical protein
MPYSITPADLDRDKQEILALWKRNFPNIPEERYDWIYKNNPAGPALCYVARDSRGKVIGSASIFPRRFFINNSVCETTILGGIAGDFIIDKEHRGFGPAFSLQKMLISEAKEKKFDILYGFPNAQSKLLLKRVGYKDLGNLIRLTKPLRSEYFLKRYLNIPKVTGELSKPVDIFLKIFSKEEYYKSPPEFNFEILQTVDKRFDDLWENGRSQFFTIGERNCSYIEWRFIKSPLTNHKIFVLKNQFNDKIFGYLIFHTSKNKTLIDDLFFKEKNKIIDSMFSKFLIFQKKEGIDSVSVNIIGLPFLIKKIKQYGFSERDRENDLIIYDLNGKYLNNLNNKKEWYFSFGDNDIP